jgi:hypothetical protein
MIFLLTLVLQTSAETQKNSYSDIDRLKAKDRYIRQCKNVRVGWKGNWNTECAEPFQHYVVVDQTGLPTETKEALLDRLQRQRENELAEGGHYMYHSEIVNGTSVTFQPAKEGTVSWCSVPGWFPHAKDSCRLCEAVNDSFIIPRAYITWDRKHMCVCHKWGQGLEQFMVCNCDLCDALLIHSGLRGQCKKMYQECQPQKYLSAYATLENHNAFFKRYNEQDDLGMAPDDLVGEVLKYQSNCRSGLQGKTTESHEGQPLFRDERPRSECNG